MRFRTVRAITGVIVSAGAAALFAVVPHAQASGGQYCNTIASQGNQRYPQPAHCFSTNQANLADIVHQDWNGHAILATMRTSICTNSDGIYYGCGPLLYVWSHYVRGCNPTASLAHMPHGWNDTVRVVYVSASSHCRMGLLFRNSGGNTNNNPVPSDYLILAVGRVMFLNGTFMDRQASSIELSE